MKLNRLVVAISGASGAIYGIRALELLKECEIETHLILTVTAMKTIKHETSYDVELVRSLASHVYEEDDLGASISSGSFRTCGMLIVPCSVNSMSGIAIGLSSNLLLRAACVTIKESRKLVLMVRESPLHLVHLRNMVSLAEMGVVVMPPVPAFYNSPNSIKEIVDHSVYRALRCFGVYPNDVNEWSGV